MKIITLALALMTLLLSCKQETAKINDKTVVEASQTPQSSNTTTQPPSTTRQSANKDKQAKDFGISSNKKNILGGLKVGDLAPNFVVKSNRGSTLELERITEHRPVLLTFFRGDWCPYCTKSLAKFQDNLKALDNYEHTKIIAVTPQSMIHARQMANDMSIFYDVVSDENHELMEKYKVLFHVTKDYDRKILKYKGKSLAEFNGDKKAILPVPATYVIGKDMRIKYAYYNPDYTQRPNMEDIFKAME